MKIPTVVSGHSLIGSFGEYPRPWANYFWFKYNGARCLNMWAENLEEATKRFLPDNLVEVILYEHRPDILSNKPSTYWAIITDERIPKDWLYNKLCFTGGAVPPVYQIKEMYDYLGDETNEFERSS